MKWPIDRRKYLEEAWRDKSSLKNTEKREDHVRIFNIVNRRSKRREGK